MPTLYCVGGPFNRQPVRFPSPIPEIAMLGEDGQQAKYLFKKHMIVTLKGDTEVRAFYVLEGLNDIQAEEIMLELWELGADPYAE